MDYKEEADSIARIAYDLYKSTDWKVAKSSMAVWSSKEADIFLHADMSATMTDMTYIHIFEPVFPSDARSRLPLPFTMEYDIGTWSSHKDVKVFYKKSTEFDGHIYRAECVIDSPPEKVIRYILPCPRGLRGKWDKAVKESEVIEKIDEDLIVGRSATHSVAMGLISSRDFVDLITVRKYPEERTISTNSRSIQRKDCPPRDGFVRGINYHGGTFCTAVEGSMQKKDCPPKDGFVRGLNYHGGTFCTTVDGDPNSCHVVNIVQTDLSGMLPTSVVESALPASLIDFFHDLDTALKDHNMNGF